MQLIRKSGSLVKLNLRLAPEKLKAADALRQNRGGLCRRNSWMAEAIAEKLRVWWKRQRIATPSSRKGEALSGIVTPWRACLYAIPARAPLGRDDELRSEQRPARPLARSAEFALARENQSGNNGARDA